MFRWFIYDLILRNPTTSLCLLAIVVIGVFSVMIGWPAYVFLGICVLGCILYWCIGRIVKPLSIKKYREWELDEIERKYRWIMGILSIFALSGIIASMHLTLSCLKYADNTSGVIGTMALFHFILIGIPYILMNMVKRKSSFWYGLMFPVMLTAIIQFFFFSMLAESNDVIIKRFTTGGFEPLHGNWLIIGPLLFVPIFLLLDSLGKAFGFKVKDETWDMGYDKEKHQLSIVNNKKLSAIVMIISFVWCILSLAYCYYYIASLSGRSEPV